MPIRSYRDLVVWQRAIDLIAEVYALSAHFPADERFGLTAQVRRAAISVAANIAEGSARATSRDLLNFLSHSRGSLKEAESLLLIAQRLQFATAAQCARAVAIGEETGRMLNALRATIEKRNPRPTTR